jgi:DNA-binding MarR family transcriptional regulator/N-acetylglutamate synthase-like GNAT family acetyltransferase
MDGVTTKREERVAAIRAFNRFYTRQIGLLEDGIHRSEFSLAEARVIYEAAQDKSTSASAIAKKLDLDQGYLSRMITKLVDQRIVVKQPSPSDRRQYQLKLSSKGRAVFARLNRASDKLIEGMIADLPDADLARMIGAMSAIERVLTARLEHPSFLLREHRLGDMGWVVARHGELYWQAYRWDMSFEALVAEIVAQFIRNYNPACERCWIAELDGEPVGCVFLVKASEETAKLRLLLVDPKSRGLGLGRRLVEECVRFARQCGYKTVTLWTQSILISARRIYQNAGFRLVSASPHTSFGHELVGETWELSL